MAWYEDEDRGRTHPRAASGRGSIEPKEDHRQTQRSTNFRGNSEKLRARCAESRLLPVLTAAATRFDLRAAVVFLETQESIAKNRDGAHDSNDGHTG
jgi:hypothetical protein